MSQASSSLSSVNQDEFRSALGWFPTGVAVVTAGDADTENRIGMTITSFNSVSLDPPLVLFSIGKRALSLPFLIDADEYSINILGEHHQPISNRFATAKSDKWAGTEIVRHEGLPFTLADAIVSFQCKPYAQHDGGDHMIFIGQVMRIHYQQLETARPLVFFRGNYAALQSDARPVIGTRV